MLMNLIVEKVPRIKWYTDLHPFVAALGAVIDDYVWRFDDVDSVASFPNETELGVWYLLGSDMQMLVSDHPQFSWAVISAIPHHQHEESLNIAKQPYADGNPAFWTGSPKPQHPLSEFELVCWDASATLLIGADENIAAAFRTAYPEAIDLDRLNQDRDRTKR
jgi:hypothetical protein